MPTRLARGTISRPTLIWLVVALFLIGSGFGVYFAIRRSTQKPAPSGPPINLDVPPPVNPRDAGAFQGSDNGRAQFVDSDDPNRVAGELLYKRLDPLPRGRVDLEEAQLWYFLKDGRTMHLTAAKGNVKFFAGTQKPESGKFEGGVVVRRYAPGIADVLRRPDPAVQKPELLFYTQSVAFDLSIGEFTTTDVVNMSTPDFELQGEGMTLVYNEVRERADSVQIGAIGYLYSNTGDAEGKKKTADAATPANPTTPAPAQPTGTTTPPAPAAPAPAPKIDLYAVEVGGPIVLTVGSEAAKTITSDRLLAWARLINGELGPNALAELANEPEAPKRAEAPKTPAPTEPAGQTPTAPTPPPAAGEKKPGDSEKTAEPPVVPLRDRIARLRVAGPSGMLPLTEISEKGALLTWSGVLAAAAVETEPKELATEDIAIRFASEGNQPVMLMDAASGATALCDAVHYGATSAGVELTGREGATVSVDDSKGGHAEFSSLRLNLKTGVGHAPGAGSVEQRSAKATAGAERQQLVWTEQADFVFATGRNGLEAIREAMFSGGVKATTKDASIEGDYLHTWFIQPDAEKRGQSLISRAQVSGKAFGETLQDASPQRLGADKIDVTFKPSEDKEESHPARLVATGNVSGMQTQKLKDQDNPDLMVSQVATLTSELLDAELGRDDKGKTVVVDAIARGGATFERSDGLKASGEEILAKVSEETVDVKGEGARVGAGGGLIFSADLHMNAAEESVLAKGPGRIVHVDDKAAAKLEKDEKPALAPEQIGRTTLEWTKGMRYNAATGEGEAVGASVVVTSPDPFTLNTVRGETLRLRTQKVEKAPDQKKPEDGATFGEVQVLSAEAVAADPAVMPGAKAFAESRVYVVDPAAPEGRRLERLTYIEGARLSADNQNGVFHVPTPGRALVLDHSVAKKEEEASKQSSSPLGFGSSGMKGTTLLEWSGDMTMNRGTEQADVTGGVRITHQPLSANEKPLVLEADSVQAKFKLRTAGSASAPGASAATESSDQLRSTTARGAVVIRTDGGDRELRAGEATYDAVSRIVEASGVDGGTVTFLDKTRGVPTVAKRMRWNLQTDAVEILEQAPIVIPR